MRNFTILATLCALWVAAGSANAAAGGASADEAATFTVLRGTKTETVEPAKAPPGKVVIIRPVVKPPLRTAAVAERPARPRAARRTFIAGDTLWTRNARTGRLVACFVGSSGIVGKRIIRCTGPDAFGR